MRSRSGDYILCWVVAAFIALAAIGALLQMLFLTGINDEGMMLVSVCFAPLGSMLIARYEQRRAERRAREKSGQPLDR